jgi:AcrR family transcriptional regulator
MQILKDNVKLNILEAACEVFFQNSYKNASMRIIAGKSGITVGNLYRYFNNKADILDTLLTPVSTKLLELTKHTFQPIVGLEIEPVLDLIGSEIAPLTGLFSQYRREIVILLEKAAGTQYDVVKNQLTDQLTKHIFEHFSFEGIDYSVEEISSTGRSLSESFLAGLVNILKTSDDDVTIQKALQNYLRFFISGFIHLLKDLKEQ